MIPFNFEYIVAETLEEAVGVFMDILNQGKKPLYYSGGTEIITMGRMNNLNFDAVIDIKKIPECNVHQVENDKIILGSALNLKAISVTNYYPLLTHAISRIADHTTQCKITIGGNVAGTIFYHESVLPLLLADGEVLLAGPDGNRMVKLIKLFSPKLQLGVGELIVRFSFKQETAKMPYVHVKHTDGEKIGYPIVTLCGLKKGNIIRSAVSGIQKYPCMLPEMKVDSNMLPGANKDSLEHLLNTMVEQVMDGIQQPLLADTYSSGEYRQKVLKDSLFNMLERLVVSL